MRQECSTWEELIAKAKSGDSQAYRNLLEEVRAPLTRYFTTHSFSAEQAEDLMQNTLLRMHLYRDKFDGRGRFSSWLFAIARNVAIDHVRVGKEQPELSEEETDLISVESEVESQMTLQSAVGSLSGDQLEIIRLVQVMGLSLSEASAQLGISISAAKVRAHRAYHALKDAMARMFLASMIA